MWQGANILKISKPITLLVKMKNFTFILWKKLFGLFGQSNILSIILLFEYFTSKNIIKYLPCQVRTGSPKGHDPCLHRSKLKLNIKN